MIPKEIEKILLSVEKPGRYVGGEHNQIRKDWDSVKTHVALIFQISMTSVNLIWVWPFFMTY
jgi:hypothetical protein